MTRSYPQFENFTAYLKFVMRTRLEYVAASPEYREPVAWIHRKGDALITMYEVGRNASHNFHLGFDSDGNAYEMAYAPEEFANPDWKPEDNIKPVDPYDVLDDRVYIGHY